MEIISRGVPLEKTVVITGIEIFRTSKERAIGRHKSVFRLHKDGPLLAGSLGSSLHDMDLCLTVFNDFYPIKSLLENVERCIGCVYFKVFFST
jgi:hypothetical protein